jgi:hypothetical protein
LARHKNYWLKSQLGNQEVVLNLKEKNNTSSSELSLMLNHAFVSHLTRNKFTPLWVTAAFALVNRSDHACADEEDGDG